MVPTASDCHARKHVRSWKRYLIPLPLPIIQWLYYLRRWILENAIESPHRQDVCVQEEDLLVLRLLEHAQFRHDVQPERVADGEPIRQGHVIDFYHYRAVFSKSGPLELRDTFRG